MCMHTMHKQDRLTNVTFSEAENATYQAEMEIEIFG